MNPDFRDMLSALSDAEVEYLVVGAYALAAHGHPRATGDLGVWVRPTRDNALRVLAALARFGAPTQSFTSVDLQTPDLVIQIGVAPRRIDLLTSTDGVTFDDAWPERTTVEIDGLAVPVLSRAHLLQNKRTMDRPQDRVDVARLENPDDVEP